MISDKIKKYFTEGDIYIVRDVYFYDDFYRIKKVCDESVMVEKLGVDFTLEFDKDDFRKTCLKEENYELSSYTNYQKRGYHFNLPNYNFILKEKPNNEVVSTIRMTIEYDQFHPEKVYLRNKTKGLYLDEKYSGKCVEKSLQSLYFNNYYGKDRKVISQDYEDILNECFRKSDEMTKDYYKTPEGIKEEEEFNNKVEEDSKYDENIKTQLKRLCEVVLNHRIMTGRIKLSPDEVEDYMKKLYRECEDSLWKITVSY